MLLFSSFFCCLCSIKEKSDNIYNMYICIHMVVFEDRLINRMTCNFVISGKRKITLGRYTPSTDIKKCINNWLTFRNLPDLAV